MSSYFPLRHNRSIIGLSIQHARPSLLTDVPADSTASMATVALNAARCFFRFGLVFIGLVLSWPTRPAKP